jgi:hypothetical protein
MRTWLGWIALSLAMLVPAVAGDRAGLIAWPVGAAGVTVQISPPISNANYSAIVQPTNTAGYSGISDCTYFNVLKLTPTQFEVQHKKCKDGVPVPTVTTITLEWIITTHPE